MALFDKYNNSVPAWWGHRQSYLVANSRSACDPTRHGFCAVAMACPTNSQYVAPSDIPRSALDEANQRTQPRLSSEIIPTPQQIP